jgi:hypothetical protein
MSLLSFRDIAKIFEEIELRLIASLKRNLSRHKAEEEKEGFEWSAWQAEKLNNIDNFRKENAQIADEYVDVIDDETRQLMTDQFHEGEHTAEQSVIDVSESGVNVPDVPDVPAQPQPPEAPTAIPDDHFFGVNKPKMDKLMEDVTTLEKTALTAAVRNMDDVYRTTLNKVQLMMGTGSITLNEAIDLATRDFLDKGINCIVYADGRRVNIADYVRMALRTTSTRATLQGAAKRFAELGYDTVLISQYGGCSETCEPYQGKVYIDDVFTIWNGERSGDFGKSNYCDKWFMLLSVAIRGGLFHPNCRHTMGQYIEGLTKIPKPIPAEKIREQRALEEKQRAMERKIRALKRKVEGTQDEKKVKEYKRKLREEQGKLREFIKEHDDVLRRDYSREKIYSGEGEPKQAAPRTEEVPMSKLPENTTPQLPEVTQDSPKAKKIMSEGVVLKEKDKNSGTPITPITEKSIEKVPLINISGYNDEYCEYVQRKHKELLEYSRDNNAGNEVAFIVDKDMVEREPIIGDDEKISFGELYGRDLFIMHNHPRNNSYSIDDIVEFLGGSNVKSLSIVKNNGKVEVLTKLMEYDRMTTIKELDRMIRKNIKTGSDSEYRAIVNKFLSKYVELGVIEWLK